MPAQLLFEEQVPAPGGPAEGGVAPATEDRDEEDGRPRADDEPVTPAELAPAAGTEAGPVIQPAAGSGGEAGAQGAVLGEQESGSSLARTGLPLGVLVLLGAALLLLGGALRRGTSSREKRL